MDNHVEYVACTRVRLAGCLRIKQRLARHYFSHKATMSRREITALSLPPSTMRSLLKAGYETTDDLNATTPEALAKGGLHTNP